MSHHVFGQYTYIYIYIHMYIYIYLNIYIYIYISSWFSTCVISRLSKLDFAVISALRREDDCGSCSPDGGDPSAGKE